MSRNKNQISNMGKAVHFAQSCTLRFFTAPTRRTKDTLWYNPSDYSAFREECKTVLKLVRLAGVKAVEETGKYTCRGLEHMYSKKLAYLRVDRRNEAWDAVELAQRLSVSSGASPDFIAELCHGISKQCHVDAHKRATVYFDEELPRDDANCSRNAENKLVDSVKVRMPLAKMPSSMMVDKFNNRIVLRKVGPAAMVA
jgi:hypothetical protein